MLAAARRQPGDAIKAAGSRDAAAGLAVMEEMLARGLSAGGDTPKVSRDPYGELCNPYAKLLLKL